MRFVIFAVFLVGCAPLPTEPPAEADVLVAVEVAADYYRSKPEWPRPTIEWVVGVRCIETPEPVGCADGWFYPKENRIVIGWWTGWLPSSGLTHELYHWHLWHRDHNSDGGHVSRAWDLLVPEAEIRVAGALLQ